MNGISVRLIGDPYVFDEDHPFAQQAATFAVIQVGLSYAGAGQPVNLDKPMLILNKGKVVDSVLLNGRELIRAIRNAEILPPPQYSVVEAPDLPQPGRTPDYRVPSPAWKHAAQVCIGSAYEAVRKKLYTDFGPQEVKWHPALQLFRHARHAGAHGNKLRRLSCHAIDPRNPPAWRGTTFPNAESLTGLEFFGAILGAGDCPILLGDVAPLLRKDM